MDHNQLFFKVNTVCLIIYETRNTQGVQASLAEADHYSHIAHCKNVEPWW